MKKFLNIKNLTIAFSKIENEGQNFILRFFIDKKKTYTLLKNVNLSVFEGEYLGLVGESGCGKSLTMKSVFGMIDFNPGIVSGQIKLYDNENNNKISILNTDNNKYFNKYISSAYLNKQHLSIKKGIVDIPINTVVDKNTRLTLYNKDGDYKNIKCATSNYVLSESEKKFTHCYISSYKYIPFNNKKNIPNILKSSKDNNIPGKFVSIILQDPLSFMNPYWSMYRQMSNLQNLHPSKEVNDMEPILDNLKLNNNSFKNALPRELSGGQGQRAMIVLSSLTKPKLLIADEPTTGLDVTLKKIVVEKFKGLKDSISKNFSMIFISHDLNMVRRATKRMNVMYQGQIIENGFSKDFLSSKKHHPYTSKLINITQSNFKTKSSNKGNNMDNDFDGCPYYSLCEHKSKNNLCAQVMPPAINIADGSINNNEDPLIPWVKCWSFLKDQE